jgi:hypothetical protein
MADSQENTACPNCGNEISSKAIACKHCGTILKEVGNDSLRTLVVDRPKNLEDPILPDTQPFTQGTSKFNSNAVLYISIERLHTPIARYVQQDPIILGRVDPGETAELTRKDIDLSPYQARERGVSRRHAQIFEQDGQLFISDLGSSNGTTLNGITIEPGEVHQVRDGDEIILGRMMLWVNF